MTFWQTVAAVALGVAIADVVGDVGAWLGDSMRRAWRKTRRDAETELDEHFRPWLAGSSKRQSQFIVDEMVSRSDKGGGGDSDAV